MGFAALTRKPGDLPSTSPIDLSGATDEGENGMTSTSIASSRMVSLGKERLALALLAFLVGSFLVLGVGFAHSEVIHNAAHDSRHSLAFPCH